MDLTQYKPQSKLVTKETLVSRPRFAAIDAHNHLADPFGGGWDHRPVAMLLDQLDQAGIIHYIDLDGGWGEDILYRHLDTIKTFAPERFSIFGGVDWSKWPEMGDGFPEWAAGRILVQKEHGASGLKIWKGFGLQVKDQHSQLVRINDPRLQPLWQTCAELQLPIVIHVADPVAFFDPIDETNERWEELGNHPEWAFPSPPYPPFISILNDFADLVKNSPQTLFIGAHVGCYAENLHWVSVLLDCCPNFNVDIAARIGELGRQPYSAKQFFLKHSDRILFGLDMGPDIENYRINYRFLETDDEYFNYSAGSIPQQGRWHISGLFLPDDVLLKVYRTNAERLILRKQIRENENAQQPNSKDWKK
jgi:predicted TIM-barrel fold metal-dependent hydrolase